MPRHLHNNAQHIFGLENLQDGRHCLLQRHATRTTMPSIYFVWKIKRWPPLSLATPCHLRNNAQHIFGLENLKDGRHYAMPRHNKAQHIFGLQN
jgi:hypothetical protein